MVRDTTSEIRRAPERSPNHEQSRTGACNMRPSTPFETCAPSARSRQDASPAALMLLIDCSTPRVKCLSHRVTQAPCTARSQTAAPWAYLRTTLCSGGPSLGPAARMRSADSLAQSRRPWTCSRIAIASWHVGDPEPDHRRRFLWRSTTRAQVRQSHPQVTLT